MGSTRKSSRSKIAHRRMVKSSRLPSRSHPMILRRAPPQSRFVSAYTATTTSHATPTLDPAPISIDASLTSDPAPATLHEVAPIPDVSSAFLPTNRPDLVFAKEAGDYMKRSMEILQTQTETLILFNQKLTSLNEDKESLENETEQEMITRVTEYRCPLCSDLAWDPYVLLCGHSFCSQCLSQYKATHVQKRSENPDGTEVIIRCPTCHALVLRRPQFSHTIRRGVEDIANHFQRVVPASRQLEWPY